ncbi:glycoside hydrolase family 15 protein [Lichenibacterium dinghuense]|uniref:glycoside hydrolase family 15 protein n=1 Tax=Lichenibacterium dinghuense TaxID=2895977 RepID=UPI001F307FD0|nr:glycoside hydrolase family 15 protein [Lichenibacterium sp. 6Y81]
MAGSASTVVEPAPAPARDMPSRFNDDLALAAVGNCNIAALVDRNARISWCCFPRLDSDAIFCGLIDDAHDPYDGCFTVEIEDLARSEQHYRRNTAIVSTVLTAHDGSSVEVVDFAPRFRKHDRMTRPSMIVRRVFPRAGSPRIRVLVRPKPAFEGGTFVRRVGSHHISFVGNETSFRLMASGPISYIAEEVPFVLGEPLDLLLGLDEYLHKSVAETARELFEQTEQHWFEWSRNLSIPFEWQDVVIRSSITLKLCSFEDTGAIVAALTTSIPESAGSGRNWDYRYCWLRDSFFVVNALNHLGATNMMEEFIAYITNVAALSDDKSLKPVYGVVPGHPLEERFVGSLGGYRGMGPVRVGNKAEEQVQNDVYGSTILAATQMFFDERLSRPGDRGLFERLESLGRVAARVAFTPDASLWEFRGRTEVHTYTAAMCWAACDRLEAIADRLGLRERAAHWAELGGPIRERILAEAWDEDRGTFVGSLGGDELDASLLLLSDIGFVAADDPRFIGTVEAIGRELKRGDHLMRYTRPDDFGEPEAAFMVCTFWYVDALCAIGRTDEARVIFEAVLASRNHVGLLSEDIDPRTGELWGNFPQSYSMVGLVNSAMRLSRPWNNALTRSR